MLAASFWSLLAPAIEMAVEFSGYSESFAFIPGAIGLIMELCSFTRAISSPGRRGLVDVVDGRKERR